MRVIFPLLILLALSGSALAQITQPPRSSAPANPNQQQNQQPPSASGRDHSAETDPFLKYAENVEMRITQLDLRDFPTVRLFATASDEQGVQIRTLQEGDFKLAENRVDATDLRFANRAELDLPLAIMFVVDISASMQEGDAIEREKEAIRQFVSQLGPKDRVGLITFSDAAIPEVDLTTDKERLLRAVDSMVAWGQTAVWDGVYRGMEALLQDDQPARRAMLVLSDGGDNRSVETPQTIGALYKDQGQAQNKGFAVYALGLGTQVDRGALGNIATVTNGLYVDSPSADSLADIYGDILRQIQNEYCLEYTSPTTSSAGQIIDISLGLTNVKSFTPATYTYRSPGLAAALGRALWPGLILIGTLLALLVIFTIFKITRRAWLTVMLTPLEGRDFALGSGGDLDIGRSEACAIRVGRDPLLQAVHAALRETTDGWVIEAYDQTAPVIYGKQLLARKLLRHGDAFMLGNTGFIFNERIERAGSGRAEPVGIGAPAPGAEPPLPPLAPLGNAATGAGDPAVTAPRKAPVGLVGISGPYSGQRFELAPGENHLGRTQGTLLLANDGQVSGRHCVVTLSGDTAGVADSGSTNGTRLNGKTLQPGLPSPLWAGDVLGVGSSEFRAE